MSIMVGTGRGATAGVLVKHAEALEVMERVDTVVVDKTGTLTEGRPRLVTLVALPPDDEAELLRLAASLEQASEHPLAARDRGGRPRAQARARGGRGVPRPAGAGRRGPRRARRVALGNVRLLETLGIPPGDLAARADALRREGQTAVLVAVDDRPAGLVAVADPIKARRRKRSGGSARTGSASSW